MANKFSILALIHDCSAETGSFSTIVLFNCVFIFCLIIIFDGTYRSRVPNLHYCTIVVFDDLTLQNMPEFFF